MRRNFGIVLLVLPLVVSVAVAQELTPVFVVDHNQDGSVLPILVKKGRTGTGNVTDGFTEEGSYTGTRTMDTYIGLRRYDDERLLLGVYNNGINEEDSGDNLALAAQYPDYSLLWINEGDGSPMGVAIEIGVDVVEFSDEFLTANNGIPFFMAFDVDGAGNVYVNFGNHIIRYEPDGNGGFGPPNVVHIVDLATYGAYDTYPASFHVNGSGPDTVINFGNGTALILATTDGDNFEVVGTYVRAGWPPIGGGSSGIFTNETDGELWIYTAGFGNNSNGSDSSFYRIASLGTDVRDVLFEDDNDFFTARGVPDADPATQYRARYVADMDGDDSLPYMVAYGTPAWNTAIEPATPGFLAVHDVATSRAIGEPDGEFISAITLNVLTTEEARRPGDTTTSFYGATGTVEVNIPAGAETGAAEVIWGGGVYGYGRFTIGNTDIGDWSVY